MGRATKACALHWSKRFPPVWINLLTENTSHSKFLLRTTMMKVLMVFYASVAISALVVEDGLRVIQGVAELMMICRLCMLF